ncbi:MAG: RloB family protein [Lentilactobacillus diolivorans]|jgi:hypothetical protein|nr:RloB family protein [Lentilactobacillus diolivorans]RRG03116.1 MAG: RloB domain-containing protein [Lactobacillus sp.]
MARRSKGIPLKPIIVIYCEGESEKAYFEMLKRKYHATTVHTEKIAVESIGIKGMPLLQKAVRKIQKLQKKKKIDQSYVVFDRDDLSRSELQQCEKFANENRIQILFSSINIEIWILMHFQTVNRAYQASELNQILSGKDFFDTDYRRFKGASYDHFLFDRVKTAMINANRLEKGQSKPWYDCNPYTNINDFITKIFNVTEF